MTFLLTSGGIKNTSIHDAWQLISGRAATPCANWVGSPWEYVLAESDAEPASDPIDRGPSVWRASDRR
jgi:hypothetical protein